MCYAVTVTCWFNRRTAILRYCANGWRKKHNGIEHSPKRNIAILLLHGDAALSSMAAVGIDIAKKSTSSAHPGLRSQDGSHRLWMQVIKEVVATYGRRIWIDEERLTGNARGNAGGHPDVIIFLGVCHDG